MQWNQTCCRKGIPLLEKTAENRSARRTGSDARQTVQTPHMPTQRANLASAQTQIYACLLGQFPHVQFRMSQILHIQFYTSNSAGPILQVQFCKSNSARPILHVQFRTSKSARPSLHVQFCMSNSARPVLHIQFAFMSDLPNEQ